MLTNRAQRGRRLTVYRCECGYVLQVRQPLNDNQKRTFGCPSCNAKGVWREIREPHEMVVTK